MSVPATLPHRAGIEGLRAIAVTAVLLYHAGVTWLPGGFLGVDVFFAISGYLITSLLLAEVVSTGGVSVKGFWRRRARRLLPAVAVLLAGVTLLAMVLADDALARLRGDVLAATTYSSNWWQIIRGETYFESFGRPPLLRHLWSLAVEEQLYILLPLGTAVLVRRRWLRYRRLLSLGAVVLAIGSAVLLRITWVDADPSRAWYGTDTRAIALLLGVAAALRWPMAKRKRWTGSARATIDAIALGSLGGLVVLFTTMGDRDPSLPAWGFVATGVLSTALVVAVTSPSSRLHRYLAIRPLRWVGIRSYAMYLWHWPIDALTRPHVDVAFGGWRVLALRLALTALAAELSWRLVEHPFRSGAVWRAWWQLRRGVRVRVALTATSAAVVLAAALGAGLASAPAEERPELLATASQIQSSETTLVSIPRTTTSTSTSTSTTTTTTTTTILAAAQTTAAPTTTAPPPRPAPPAGAILAVGDSVMLAAQPTLEAASGGRMYVDAAIGRQVEHGLMVLEHYRQNGTLAQVSGLILHLGTNGPMSDDLFNQLAVITREVPRVVVLNVRVPKPWETQSNAAINGGTGRFPFMRLGDWFTESAAPGALASDGVHPSHEGARIYSYVAMSGLAADPPPPTTTAVPATTTTTTAATTTVTTTTATVIWPQSASTVTSRTGT